LHQKRDSIPNALIIALFSNFYDKNQSNLDCLNIDEEMEKFVFKMLSQFSVTTPKVRDTNIILAQHVTCCICNVKSEMKKCENYKKKI
jgi:hypothetical protein